MTTYKIPGYRGRMTQAKTCRLLAEAQNWRCCWCGAMMEIRVKDEPLTALTATIEHVHPISAGGAKRCWFNVAAAHKICNNRRARYDSPQWAWWTEGLEAALAAAN